MPCHHEFPLHPSAAQVEIRDTPSFQPQSDFVGKHLCVPPNEIINQIEALIKAKVADYRETRLETKGGYALLCWILNKASHVIQQDLLKQGEVKPGDKIVFLDHHTSALRHHPVSETRAAPDIVGIRSRFLRRLRKVEGLLKVSGKTYSGISWHFSETIVEGKSRRNAERGSSKTGAYAGLHNQARPDKPGVYALASSPFGYTILWSDAVGPQSSEMFGWDVLQPLICYIYSLYKPPGGHLMFDNTITLERGHGLSDEPLWRVQFEGKDYRNCRVLSVSPPWFRMSWVAVGQNSANKMVVIKDQYHTIGKRYTEAKHFDDIQSGIPGNVYEGLVHVCAAGYVDGVFTQGKHRQKTRIVMESLGDSLWNCNSLLEFFKVMYDTLEVHRWLVTEKKVLHRDLSFNNVLIPVSQQERKGDAGSQGTDARPKFVDEIIESRPNAPSHALVCDLDNAASLSDHDFSASFYEGVTPGHAVDNWDLILPSPPPSEPVVVLDHKPGRVELAKRTGTPMFIARAVAKGSLRKYTPIESPLPTLLGVIKESYERIRATDLLRLWQDDEHHVHGCPTTLRPERKTLSNNQDLRKEKFYHHPRYDAESVFWIALVFLLRAQPSDDPNDTRRRTEREIVDVNDTADDADEEQDEEDEEEIDFSDDPEEQESFPPQESFAQSSAGSGEVEESARQKALDATWTQLVSHEVNQDISDSRELLFTTSRWDLLFHERFSFLGPIIKQLAEQVEPEYAYLDPQPNPLHLHEAMQRIFLRAIHHLDKVLCNPYPLSAELRPVRIRLGPAQVVKGIVGMGSRKRTIVSEEADSITKKQKIR